MESAERLCNQIALIDKGRAVLSGSLASIKEKFGNNTVQLEFDDGHLVIVFGRAHWWVNAGGPWGLINIPPAEGETLGRHRVEMSMNFDPGRRLRMYQFDPFHHDVSIFSIH